MTFFFSYVIVDNCGIKREKIYQGHLFTLFSEQIIEFFLCVVRKQMHDVVIESELELWKQINLKSLI